MKTRRTFVKGLLGIVVGITGALLVKAEAKRPKHNKDWEAGVMAAIEAGKGPRPALGWKCYVESLHHPQRHFQEGMIRTINFKDKTITVCILDD